MADAKFVDIRLRAAHLSDEAKALRDQVKATYFKRMLSDAILDIEELESVLRQAESATSPKARELWVNAAAVRVQITTATVAAVKGAIAKFGVDADVVGWD
jgi:hypothetical protein